MAGIRAKARNTIGIFGTRKQSASSLAVIIGLGAIMGLSMATAAGTETPKSPAIMYECSHSATVNPTMAEVICAEFFVALKENSPGFEIHAGRDGKYVIAVKVTKANERAIGMEVTWSDDNGQVTTGIPLQMSFFDRNSDPELRKRFYAEFLRQNPIPFQF